MTLKYLLFCHCSLSESFWFLKSQGSCNHLTGGALNSPQKRFLTLLQTKLETFLSFTNRNRIECLIPTCAWYILSIFLLYISAKVRYEIRIPLLSHFLLFYV